MLTPWPVGAHGVDDGLVVWLAEDGRAGHEGVGAGCGGGGDVVDLDAAIDFQHDVAARFIDLAAASAIFFSASGMKDWPPKPG
jgi:hypothetical protein